MSLPVGVVVGSDGKIYVANQGGNFVQVFKSDGVFLGQFNVPTNLISAMAQGPDGNLYISSTNGNQVVVVSTTGLPVTTIGFIPSSSPFGLTFDGNGNLYVAYSGSDKIVEYNTSTGESIKEFGTNVPDLLSNP